MDAADHSADLTAVIMQPACVANRRRYSRSPTILLTYLYALTRYFLISK